jgi:hypothetical protein
MRLKMIQEKEWNEIEDYIRRFENYEELVMDALELPEKTTSRRSMFYALNDLYFDGNTKEFYQFIKNNSRIVRTARMSGDMVVRGDAVVELTEDQSAEDIDWNDAVFDPDDLEDADYGDFDADGDASIDGQIAMNDYDTYAKQFVKDTEGMLRGDVR